MNYTQNEIQEKLKEIARKLKNNNSLSDMKYYLTQIDVIIRDQDFYKDPYFLSYPKEIKDKLVSSNKEAMRDLENYIDHIIYRYLIWPK